MIKTFKKIPSGGHFVIFLVLNIMSRDPRHFRIRQLTLYIEKKVFSFYQHDEEETIYAGLDADVDLILLTRYH